MEKEEVKEEFCGACAAIPLAFLGIGASRYGSKKGYRRGKKIAFWGGIASISIGLLMIIYYVYIKKCEKCR
jgi:hypothetical protein